MKLKDRYKELKRLYPDVLILLVSGSFYVTYDIDGFILNYLFSYQIKNDRVGFPSSTFDKVIELLSSKDISCIVFDKEVQTEYLKKDNTYFSFLAKAQQDFNNQLMIRTLVDRIKILVNNDSHNYIKIKEFIDAL